MQFYDEHYRDTKAQYQQLSDFLIETYALTGRPDNWLAGRLQDWKYGANAQLAEHDPDFFKQKVHLWRNPAGTLVGFCIAEYGDGSLYLQAHPHYRQLEDAMLAWAEAARPSRNDTIATYAYTCDTQREQLLQRRGYADAGECGRTYTFGLARQYPAAPLPAGFWITSLAEHCNIGSHVEAVRSAFGRDTLDRAWFERKISAPAYAMEWDLAVISPEGEHAAFCLAHLDWRNCIAELDPIGTRPEYQRRGLAQALVGECFRRLHACGMRRAYIGAGPEPAVGNRLYERLQPLETCQEHQWVKHLP